MHVSKKYGFVVTDNHLLFFNHKVYKDFLLPHWKKNHYKIILSKTLKAVFHKATIENIDDLISKFSDYFESIVPACLTKKKETHSLCECIYCIWKQHVKNIWHYSWVEIYCTVFKNCYLLTWSDNEQQHYRSVLTRGYWLTDFLCK